MLVSELASLYSCHLVLSILHAGQRESLKGNRALPDVELGGFVDALARRIASFDRRAIVAAKNLVNQVSLPSADRLLDALNSFQTALTWPETQQRVKPLLNPGPQHDRQFYKPVPPRPPPPRATA